VSHRLVHDFDYERWPNADHAPDREHPAEGAKNSCRERGYPEELVRAVVNVPRDYCNQRRARHPLNIRLPPATRQLAIPITACCYCAPVKKILDLEMESVKKKLKGKKPSAKGVSRDDFATRRRIGHFPTKNTSRSASAPCAENAEASASAEPLTRPVLQAAEKKGAITEF